MSAVRFSDEVVGLIPARGGSKSVPYKNVADLGGWPLLRWVAEAGKASRSLGRLFCSTDDARIAAVAEACGAAIHRRPPELATDDAPVAAAIVHFLNTLAAADGVVPGAVALLQPTSPFVTAEQIDAAVAALRGDAAARSVQTVTKPPHNHHAFNQREIADGHVRFRFEAERAAAYNKQRKPTLWVFGNLVVTRSEALLAGEGVFATPSLAVPVEAVTALDVDAADDFALAEWYLQTGRISRPG